MWCRILQIVQQYDAFNIVRNHTHVIHMYWTDSTVNTALVTKTLGMYINRGWWVLSYAIFSTFINQDSI